jgi:DinB family protein
MKFLSIIALLVLCGMGVSAAAQSKDTQKAASKQAAESEKDEIPKSVAESVSGPLQFIEGSFLGVVEAMPEEKYSFIPTAGKFDDARSFGEQVKHVACAQFAFFNEFEGKEPPVDCEKGGHDPAKSKGELIKYLKDSFDYSNRVLATLTAENSLKRVEGRYAGPNTKLGISVVAVWHITDHYGQLVEYLRMNGIVPPVTQKYGLKVR